MSDSERTEAAGGAAVRVIVVKKKGRKKGGVSRDLREVERLERQLSKAAHRTSRAVAKGLETYRRRRRKSAARKRDGALREWPVNAARGMGVALREGSRVPIDLARAVDSRPIWRAARLGTRILLAPLRL